jgi:hypothetical protein
VRQAALLAGEDGTMPDPEMVSRAHRAAAALEQAWERWRVRHGLIAHPMPPVSSYVGYSIDEPWGRPRVVLGVDAHEAEVLAALLDSHEFSTALTSPDQAVMGHREAPERPEAAVPAGRAGAGDPRDLGHGPGSAGSVRARIPAQVPSAEGVTGRGLPGGRVAATGPVADTGTEADRGAAGEGRQVGTGAPVKSAVAADAAADVGASAGTGAVPGAEITAGAGNAGVAADAGAVVDAGLAAGAGDAGVAADAGPAADGITAEAGPAGQAAAVADAATAPAGALVRRDAGGTTVAGAPDRAVPEDAGALDHPATGGPSGAAPGREDEGAASGSPGGGHALDPGGASPDQDAVTRPAVSPQAPTARPVAPGESANDAQSLAPVRAGRGHDASESIAAELAGWAAGELPGQASARLAAWAAVGGVHVPGYHGSGTASAGTGR